MMSASGMSSCSRSALVSSSVMIPSSVAGWPSGPVDLGEPLGGHLVAPARGAHGVVDRMRHGRELDAQTGAGARPAAGEQRDLLRRAAAGLADDDVAELGHLGPDPLVGLL